MDDRAVAFAWSQDDRLLATAHLSGAVCLWDASSGTLLAEAQHFRSYGLGPDVSGMAFSPDAHTLAFAGDDAGVHLWTLQDGRHRIIRIGEQVRAMVWSSDGSSIVAATGGYLMDPAAESREKVSYNYQVHLARVVAVDVQTGRILSSVQVPGMLNTVLSANGKRFAGTVLTLAPSTTLPAMLWNPPLRFAPAVLEVRDVAGGEVLLRKGPPSGWWTELSPEGGKVRSGESLWDVANGRELLHSELNLGHFLDEHRIDVGKAGQKAKFLSTIPWLEWKERNLDGRRTRVLGRFLGRNEVAALRMPVEAWSWDRTLVVDPALRIWRVPR
jgi:hypothetical protein